MPSEPQTVRAERTRAVAAAVCLVLGGVLVAVSMVVGLANRELLDQGRFSRHVNAIRVDPAVAAQVGQAVTDRVLQLDPDLVVLRPLIQLTVTRVVASSAFDPIVAGLARQVHSAFTNPDSKQVLLRLADVGAVVVPVLRALAPQRAAALPADFDVTLARIGGQDFAGTSIDWAHRVRVLSWALPLAAAVLFLLALLLSRRRWRAVGGVGVALAGGAALTGVGLLTAGVLVARQPEDTLRGAIVRAAWREITAAAPESVTTVLVVGLVLALVGSGWLATGALADAPLRALSWVRDQGRAGGHRRVVWSLAMGVLGALLLLRPYGTLRVAAVLVGMSLLWLAVGRLVPGRAGPAPSSVGTGAGSRTRRGVGIAVMVLAGLVLAGLLVVALRPTVGHDPAAARAAPATTCNGYAALCGRRYDQVAYPGTHNSMSAADQPGWLFAEQPDGIVAQLDAGIRVLLFDTWMGQPTRRAGVITNVAAWRDKALAVSNGDLGAATVASALRLHKLTGLAPTGPAQPYLCHGVCEFGATRWEPEMVRVRAWMQAHPREVVTFFIQDEGVTPEQTATVFQQAGLLPLVHTQAAGVPWPTLEQMISSGRRLVVLMENQDGGTRYPWQLPGFRWTQDTPYDFTSADQFSCARLRGEPDSPLFLVNHWLSNGYRRVSDSTAVNGADVLGPRLEQCRAQRRQIPNFVAVDFYDRGDLFGVVDQLNGVP